MNKTSFNINFKNPTHPNTKLNKIHNFAKLSDNISLATKLSHHWQLIQKPDQYR
ncbi:hypothetical protein SALWKB12_0131 [Snodgrassella communis]|uniref:Uncharacterized protein n=1 Tax=Snodgrassella communis TaxID=2946699 RepID=A0A836MP99_9NEIS|nr:hypothetical protein SALWKB12_0131 [Snodgrassella communis]KDN14009.1 hypothetical protein SALWKB29_1911 [Snodgrassella communis]